MKIKGQNLIEFLLIVGLIAIVCILALTTLGQNINLSFLSSYNKVKGFQPFGKDPNYLTKVTGGSLGGTFAAPKQQCQGNVCDLDLGPFAISGIPSNFGEFVEASGSSGGTEKLAAIISQLADQLKEQGDDDGYSEFMKMAELARMMGDMQKQDEQAATSCKASSGTVAGDTAHTCFKTYYDSNPAPALRSSLSTVLTDYNAKAKDKDIVVYNDIGQARNSKLTDSTEYNSLKTTYPSYALVDTFDSIMSNSKYSSELKSITTKVYQNLGDIATNHSVYTGNYGFGVWDLPTVNYDSITGSERTPIDYGWDTFNSQGLTEILTPQSSSETDLAAALLCTSSSNYNNGNACK